MHLKTELGRTAETGKLPDLFVFLSVLCSIVNVFIYVYVYSVSAFEILLIRKKLYKLQYITIQIDENNTKSAKKDKGNGQESTVKHLRGTRVWSIFITAIGSHVLSFASPAA